MKPTIWACHSDTRTTNTGRAAKYIPGYEKPTIAHALEHDLGASSFTACGRRIFKPVEAPQTAKRCAACTKVIEESKIRKRDGQTARKVAAC